ARASIHGKLIYVTPAVGTAWGKLTLARQKPDDALNAVSFPIHGTRVDGIPYLGLRTALWHACRNYPLIPTK
ncbi:hypothetical protein ACPXAU_23870, partial [Salmonella enterica]|uniref:hypothetical protein n=1 Tax=Salmonella enterica TaxID=28901 RepID=UPI003CF3C2F7